MDRRASLALLALVMVAAEPGARADVGVPLFSCGACGNDDLVPEPDLSVPRDLRQPDLRPLLDLAYPPDEAVPLDLAEPPEMGAPADRGVPDQSLDGPRDLNGSDLKDGGRIGHRLRPRPARSGGPRHAGASLLLLASFGVVALRLRRAQTPG